VIYGLLAFSTIALLIGQLLFKAVALRGTFGFPLLSDPTGLVLFLGALATYGLSTIAWVIVLQTMPLSTAYPFLALGFALMPFLSHFVFDEPLSLSLFIGSSMIVGGILVIVASESGRG
jgi:multidrug transporter EmrE-like cation transporter